MWNTTLIYALFPNTLLMVQGDHVELARIFPSQGCVDRAVMELALYVPKAPSTDEERTHWDKNMQLVLDVVTGEDFPAGRSIQMGLTSGAQTHLVYGRNAPWLRTLSRPALRWPTRAALRRAAIALPAALATMRIHLARSRRLNRRNGEPSCTSNVCTRHVHRFACLCEAGQFPM